MSENRWDKKRAEAAEYLNNINKPTLSDKKMQEYTDYYNNRILPDTAKNWVNNAYDFINQTSSDYNNRSGQYQSQDYYNQYRADTTEKISALKQDASKALMYGRTIKDKDAYASYTSNVQSMIDYLNDLDKNLQSEQEFMTQFQDADEYQQAKRYVEAVNLSEEDIQEKRHRINEITKKTGGSGKYKYKTDLTNEEKINYLSELERLQEDIAIYDDYHLEQSYEKYKENPDFEDIISSTPRSFEMENSFWRTLLFNNSAADEYVKQFDYMTEDEKDIYTYIKATEGDEHADKYLNNVAFISANYRKGKELYEMLGEGNSFLGNTVMAGIGGFDQFKAGLSGWINPEAPPTGVAIAHQMTGDAIGDGAGGFAYAAATSLSNMLPSLALSAATGGTAGAMLGSATMGVSAGGNAVRNAIQSGATLEQAYTYGIVSGTMEGGLQYVLGGISGLGGTVGKKVAAKLGTTAAGKAVTNYIANLNSAALKTALRATMKTAGGMVSEGFEEYLQDVLDPLIRNITLNENNEWGLANFADPDALYSGLIGMMTAGVLEGVSIGVNEVSIRNNGKEALNSGVWEGARDYALLLPTDTEAYRIAKSLQDGTLKVNETTVGDLYVAVSEYIADSKKLMRNGKMTTDSYAQGVDVLQRLNAQFNTNANAENQQTATPPTQMQDTTQMQNVAPQTGTDGVSLPILDNSIYQQVKAVETNEKAAVRTANILARLHSGDKLSSADIDYISSPNNKARRMLESQTGITLGNTASNSRVALKEYIATQQSAPAHAAVPNANTSQGKTNTSQTQTKAGTATQNQFGALGTAAYDLYRKNVTTPEGTDYFDRVFGNMYLAGTHGIPYNQVKKMFDNIGVAENVRKGAYEAGVQDAKAQNNAKAKLKAEVVNKVSQTKEAIKQRKVEKKTETKKETTVQKTDVQKHSKNNKIESGKFTLDKSMEGVKLSQKQAAAVDYLKVVSEVCGINIEVYSGVDAAGNLSKENGYYDPDTNTIHVAATAGMRSVNAVVDSAILRTAAHEITHQIRASGSELYSDLRDYVVETFIEEHGNDGMTARIMELQEKYKKQTGKTLDYAAAEEEMVANACEMMLKDSKVFEKLVRSNRTLAQRVKSALDAFINKLRANVAAAFAGVEAQSLEAKMMQDSVERMEQLQRLWDRALLDAAGRVYIQTENGSISYDLRTPFSEQVDSILDDENTLSKKDNPFILVKENTPQILMDIVGAKDRQVIISYESLYLAARKTGEQLGHYHNVGESIKRLPALLDDPLYILKQDNGRVSEIVELPTAKGSHCIAAIAFDTVKDIEGRYETYNLIVTVFGAKDNYIKNLIKKSEIKYKKSDESQVNPRLNKLSGIFNDSSTNISISTSDQNVNKKFELRDNPAQAQFEKNVDAVMNNTYKSDAVLILGKTPKVLRDIGLNDLPVVITPNHVYSIAATKQEAIRAGRDQDRVNYHGLGAQAVKQIYNRISDPIAIIAASDFVKRTNRDSTHKVIVLVDLSINGKQVIAPITVDFVSKFNGKLIDTNLVASYYGRSVEKMLNEAIALETNNKVGFYYADKNRIQRLLMWSRLQYPRTLSNMNSNIIIRRIEENVNREIDTFTKSRQFIRWFGDWQNNPEHASKVVNPNGTPKIVYHGTNTRGINIFEPTPSQRSIGFGGKRDVISEAYFFAENKELAQRFADNRRSTYGGSSTVMEVYLNMRRPLDLTKITQSNIDVLAKAGFDVFAQYGYKDSYDQSHTVGNAAVSPSELWEVADMHEVTRRLKNMGYDGLILKESDAEKGINGSRTSYTVFDAAQIKSATDNIGTFDKSNPDIRYELRDPDGQSSRELLAEALLTVAKTDLERQKLTAYKTASRGLDAKAAEIEQARAELTNIDEKSQHKQWVDMRIKIIKLENQLGIWDARLVNLEATKPIRDMMARQRAALKAEYNAYVAKAKADGQLRLSTKMQAQKQDNDARIQRMRDSRKDTANRLQSRTQVIKMVKRLNKLLLSNSPSKHVPEALKSSVAEVCNVFMENTSVFTLHQLDRLHAAYENLKSSDIYNEVYNQELSQDIQGLKPIMEGKRLAELSLEELKEVRKIVQHLWFIVRDANKVLVEGQSLNIDTLAKNAMAEAQAAKSGKKNAFLENSKAFTTARDWAINKNTLPIYFFKRMGKTMQSLYNDLMNGQNVWAVQHDKSKKFITEVSDKYDRYHWGNKILRLDTVNGKHLELSVEQALTIYATDKREARNKDTVNTNHLGIGGVVFENDVEVRKNKAGIPTGWKAHDKSAVRLEKADIEAINNWLTPEQKAYADEMVGYLSVDMASIGNETSMQLYGINLFNEQYYFPLNSSKHYMSEAFAATEEKLIKNAGFTKSVTRDANNPIVLSDFTRVWGQHVEKMSIYHAEAVPLNNMNRVLNYVIRADGENVDAVSVKATMEDAYGKDALSYIKQLMRDVNGGIKPVAAEGIINKMVSLFKRSAVLQSASVAIQQPSAIVRAMVMVDPKYFATTPHMGQSTWEQLKQYSPVAVIKELGKFDTNVSASSIDQLIHMEPKTIQAKAKAVLTDRIYIDSVLGMAPEFMDQIAWCHLWEAVKKETAANTDLAKDSEALLTAAGRRFTDVVNHTQVYDSIFVRSEAMRSKPGLMNMVTAFMAEPTVTYNMLMDASLNVNEPGGKKKLTRTLAVLIVNGIVNSMLQSIITAARDEDDEKTYLEKYFSHLVANVLDNLNPLSLIPLLRDIVSIFDGYNVERVDVALFSDLYRAITALGSENKPVYDKIAGMAGAIGSFLGVPVKNILRDGEALWNFVEDMFSGNQTTAEGIEYAIQDEVANTWAGKILGVKKSGTNYDKLYAAMMAGDSLSVERYTDYALKDGKTENNIRVQLRKRLIDAQQISQAYEARMRGDLAQYKSAVKSLTDKGFLENDVVLTINNHAQRLKTQQEDVLQPHEEEQEEAKRSLYTKDMLVAAFGRGDGSEREIIAAMRKDGISDSSLKSYITEYFKPIYQQAFLAQDTQEMSKIARQLIAFSEYKMRYNADTLAAWRKSAKQDINK